MKLRLLAVLVLSATLTSCATKIQIEEQECPRFPELHIIDEEMEAATPKFVIEVVSKNYALLIEWGEKLERYANCTN